MRALALIPPVLLLAGCAAGPAPVTLENHSGRAARIDLYMGCKRGPLGVQENTQRYSVLLADGQRWSTREPGLEKPPPLKMPNGPTLLFITFLKNQDHPDRASKALALETRERVTVRLGPDPAALPEIRRASDGAVIPGAARESTTDWLN